MLKELSRDEMRSVKGGVMQSECHLYCCDHSGNCGSSITPAAVTGSSHEGCQSSGLSYYGGDPCEEGTYLAALHM